MGEGCERPHLFRMYDPPARRHFIDRFPYGVIYLVEPDHIWIVVMMHLHREPGYWRKRIEGAAGLEYECNGEGLSPEIVPFAAWLNRTCAELGP